MDAIFRGRRHAIISRTDDGVWIERTTGDNPQTRHFVSASDPDLIINPTVDDLNLAEAFERGEVSAFEYPDGHTYPPDREIESHRPPKRAPPFTLH